MQPVVVAEPYQFVPPHPGTFWPWFFGRFSLWRHLRGYGVTRLTVRGGERLRASFAAGHGVLLTPNHCRPCDPFVILKMLADEGRAAYTMASWHLFKQSRLQTWILRRAGVFSVWREGMDREALRCAIDSLAAAKRPLVLFPEGVVTRANDRLLDLMEGTAFIARNAARARAAQGGQVVVHPVAIRYRHQGDTAAACAGVLADLERRLSWRPRPDLGLDERIARAGEGLLALKEIEHLGAAQTGPFPERIARLIDALLVPHEAEWLKGKREDGVVARVKALRTAILPDLAAGELPEAEAARRWRQLEDLYLAQQLSLYPPGYLAADTTPERRLETVERYEEDLTDAARIHPPLHAIVDIGDAIPVPERRERGGEGDPLMTAVRSQLETLLAASRSAP